MRRNPAICCLAHPWLKHVATYCSCRLFFVVNKMDTIRVSEGLDEDATREYVADLVTTQLADEGFQLRPEQVRFTA